MTQGKLIGFIEQGRDLLQARFDDGVVVASGSWKEGTFQAYRAYYVGGHSLPQFESRGYQLVALQEFLGDDVLRSMLVDRDGDYYAEVWA